MFSVIGFDAYKLLRSTREYIIFGLLVVAGLDLAEALHDGIARVRVPVLLARVERLRVSVELLLRNLHLVR